MEETPYCKVVGEAETGIELIQIVEQFWPDVAFVDIKMPEMDGLTAIKKIREIHPDIFIIIATGYNRFMEEAIRLYAFDYLQKPFEFERINQTMDKIKELHRDRQYARLYEEQLKQDEAKCLKLRQQGEGWHYVQPEEIFFITREDRKIIVHTSLGQLETTNTLEELEEQLKPYDIFRSQKGFLINLKKVKGLYQKGRKTWEARFENTTAVAMITIEKLKELKERLDVIHKRK